SSKGWGGPNAAGPEERSSGPAGSGGRPAAFLLGFARGGGAGGIREGDDELDLHLLVGLLVFVLVLVLILFGVGWLGRGGRGAGEDDADLLAGLQPVEGGLVADKVLVLALQLGQLLGAGLLDVALVVELFGQHHRADLDLLGRLELDLFLGDIAL